MKCIHLIPLLVMLALICSLLFFSGCHETTGPSEPGSNAATTKNTDEWNNLSLSDQNLEYTPVDPAVEDVSDLKDTKASWVISTADSNLWVVKLTGTPNLPDEGETGVRTNTGIYSRRTGKPVIPCKDWTITVPLPNRFLCQLTRYRNSAWLYDNSGKLLCEADRIEFPSRLCNTGVATKSGSWLIDENGKTLTTKKHGQIEAVYSPKNDQVVLYFLAYPEGKNFFNMADTDIDLYSFYSVKGEPITKAQADVLWAKASGETAN